MYKGDNAEHSENGIGNQRTINSIVINISKLGLKIWRKNKRRVIQQLQMIKMQQERKSKSR